MFASSPGLPTSNLHRFGKPLESATPNRLPIGICPTLQIKFGIQFSYGYAIPMRAIDSCWSYWEGKCGTMCLVSVSLKNEYRMQEQCID